MKLLKSVLAGAAVLATLSIAQADPVTHGDLAIENTWTRATPPRAKAGGGFATITNSGSSADRLVGVSSPVTGRVEIHEMAVEDGIMKMRELENGIEIPAGETVSLEPGGLHIMFMGLTEGFEEGTAIPVTLTFENAGDVDIELAVGKMGAKSMDHGGMKHGSMKHDSTGHSGHGNN
ncbi:copper chaperone PCu(A)C [Roseibium sp. RKSG952]|uniref:copper chaperone PCu(A)C n=1 Tax=Roseibium sp. RKSG952 TaxID=2529384 RepID=UPI0012BC8CDB|nr:copper chaperone PCu(A)C [Roseibium sp. RKSG952]MTH96117.1 copper chaperone PCu(A)C [Roseibium sp. RKSG952]